MPTAACVPGDGVQLREAASARKPVGTSAGAGDDYYPGDRYRDYRATLFPVGFKSFLLFLLTFFTPWSAINLVDYYFFNHQAIDMEALNDPNGKYRAWNVTGLGVYLVGVAVQTPFIDSGFYSGPFVKMLGGIDISWLIGLALPAGLYYVLRKAQSAAVAGAAISR
jgi:NCS1 family nucleobase:cation symporter-1